MSNTLDSATLSLNERLQKTNSFSSHGQNVKYKNVLRRNLFCSKDRSKRAICQLHISSPSVLPQAFEQRVQEEEGMREGQQQQCAVLVRVSNVGELTRGGDKKRSGVPKAHYSLPPPA